MTTSIYRPHSRLTTPPSKVGQATFAALYPRLLRWTKPHLRSLNRDEAVRNRSGDLLSFKFFVAFPVWTSAQFCPSQPSNHIHRASLPHHILDATVNRFSTSVNNSISCLLVQPLNPRNPETILDMISDSLKAVNRLILLFYYLQFIIFPAKSKFDFLVTATRWKMGR